MITIVLTNRNRDLRIIKKCLDSLKNQTNQEFSCLMIDYGSEEEYLDHLVELSNQYSILKLVRCCVSKQLWNKSKAINIALKQCNTPYFFVGDIDMLYHHDFIEKLYTLKKQDQAVYFQVGILSRGESELIKPFDNYVIKHKTSEGATGMTLFPTQLLKEINGYDEFYHGWGAEDTDVHIRLINAGYKVCFYNEKVLLLHQWHPKEYRSKKSKSVFHSHLEHINHQYIKQTTQQKRSLANVFFGWGTIPQPIDFSELNTNVLLISNQRSEIEALTCGILDNYEEKYVIVEIRGHAKYRSKINTLKKILGKKHFLFYDFQAINDLLLGHLISRYRNKYYEYEWNREKKYILLKIAL